MPIEYKIIPDQKIAYIRAWGKITVDEILSEGARMFGEPEWENGTNILCDYSEITDFSIDTRDIEKVVRQDKKNDPIIGKCKCAVVAKDDYVFGFSRMWEILSMDTELTSMVFRNLKDALRWLGLDRYENLLSDYQCFTTKNSE